MIDYHTNVRHQVKLFVNSILHLYFIGTGDGNTAPHALQWAVRSHQNAQSTPTTTTTAHMSGSGMVFIDTAQLRRSGASASGEGVTASSKFSAPSALARTFFVLVREVGVANVMFDMCRMSSWNVSNCWRLYSHRVC